MTQLVTRAGVVLADGDFSNQQKVKAVRAGRAVAIINDRGVRIPLGEGFGTTITAGQSVCLTHTSMEGRDMEVPVCSQCGFIECICTIKREDYLPAREKEDCGNFGYCRSALGCCKRHPAEMQDGKSVEDCKPPFDNVITRSGNAKMPVSRAQESGEEVQSNSSVSNATEKSANGAVELADDIETLYSDCDDLRCTCGSDPEGSCPRCNQWAAARLASIRLIKEALR